MSHSVFSVPCTRETGSVESLPKPVRYGVGLRLARRDDPDFARAIDRREAEAQASRRWLGGVMDGDGLRLASREEHGVAGEERGDVSVGPHTKESHIPRWVAVCGDLRRVGVGRLLRACEGVCPCAADARAASRGAGAGARLPRPAGRVRRGAEWREVMWPLDAGLVSTWQWGRVRSGYARLSPGAVQRARDTGNRSFQAEEEDVAAFSHAATAISIQRSATSSAIVSARLRKSARRDHASGFFSASCAARSCRAWATASDGADGFAMPVLFLRVRFRPARAPLGLFTRGGGAGLRRRIQRFEPGRERLALVLAADEAAARPFRRREAGRRGHTPPAVGGGRGLAPRHARVALPPAVLGDILVQRALADAGEPGDLAHRHGRALIERARAGGEVGLRRRPLPSPPALRIPLPLGERGRERAQFRQGRTSGLILDHLAIKFLRLRAQRRAAGHGYLIQLWEDAGTLREQRDGVKDYFPHRTRRPRLLGRVIRLTPQGAIVQPTEEQRKAGNKPRGKDKPQQREDCIFAHSCNLLEDARPSDIAPKFGRQYSGNRPTSAP